VGGKVGHYCMKIWTRRRKSYCYHQATTLNDQSHGYCHSLSGLYEEPMKHFDRTMSQVLWKRLAEPSGH
jgi:hypothetical protein